MQNNMTTIKAQLGDVPTSQEIRKTLLLEYETLLGSMTPLDLEEDVFGLMRELDTKFSKEKWLFQRVPKREGRDVKIREGVMILNRTFSSDDWEVGVNLELEEGKIKDLEIVKTLNFHVSEEAMKSTMIGVDFEEEGVLRTVRTLIKK